MSNSALQSQMQENEHMPQNRKKIFRTDMSMSYLHTFYAGTQQNNTQVQGKSVRISEVLPIIFKVSRCLLWKPPDNEQGLASLAADLNASKATI